MDDQNDTISMLLRQNRTMMTPSERHVADLLLDDYPATGLQSITRLASSAEVSTPTIIRLARKLGFDGFPQMQEALRQELSQQIKRPVSKLEDWRAHGDESHTITQFFQATKANLDRTMARLDSEMFDKVAELLSDMRHAVYIVGGRITRSNADYLFNHLQIIRSNVTLLSQSANVWPQYLLDMDEGAILIIFDIRRYEGEIAKLAKLAKERGCTLIVFTDQWGSPVARFADYTFHGYVEAPSSWDSTMTLMFIIEALIADVQNKRWKESRERIETLESMFSATRLFRSTK